MRKATFFPLVAAGLYAGATPAAETLQVTLKEVAPTSDDGVALVFESALSPARNPSMENWIAGVCLASIYATQRGFTRVIPKQDGGCEGEVRDGIALSNCTFEYEFDESEQIASTEYDAAEYATRCRTGLLAETDLSRLH